MLTLILYLTMRDCKKLYEQLYTDLYDNLLQRFRFLQEFITLKVTLISAEIQSLFTLFIKFL